MKKNVIALAGAISLFAFAFVGVASAHEHDTFKIGNKYYVFTVGSLNEPVVVDSMSGVDFYVSQVPAPTTGMSMGNIKSAGTPVTGLESTLKVELAAGDQKKTLTFDPASNAGHYTANFIPTVQTTYSYRIFGTLNGTPVDITFGCVNGVSEDAVDSSQVKVSDAIMRVNKVGAFGCPDGRDGYGFPEPALSSYEMSQNAAQIQAAAMGANSSAATAESLGGVGLLAGILGIVLALNARKKRQ